MAEWDGDPYDTTWISLGRVSTYQGRELEKVEWAYLPMAGAQSPGAPFPLDEQ